MRRLYLSLTLALAAFALPAVALAMDTITNDGSLVVTKASGTLVLQANGTFFARVNGTVRIRSLSNGVDDSNPVFGRGSCVGGVKDLSDQTDDPTDVVLFCKGKDVRLRVIDGGFKIRVEGSGLNFSAVGQGKGTLEADPDNTGTYSLNERPDKLLPDLPTPFLLQADKTSAV